MGKEAMVISVHFQVLLEYTMNAIPLLTEESSFERCQEGRDGLDEA